MSLRRFGCRRFINAGFLGQSQRLAYGGWVLTQNLFVEAVSWTTKLPWIDLVQSPQGRGFREIGMR